MESHLLEWINLIARWAHVVVGVAWIGTSFYFVWLDNHLLPPRDPADQRQDVAGEVWSVHGGGFYHARKFRVAPGELPQPLHWFKWEAYSTWLTGMFLLGLIYWWSADIYLISPDVAELGQVQAILVSLAFIAGGWLVYDALCRSPLGASDRALGVVVGILAAVAAWGLCQVFSGRGAFIHFGAMLGTIMVANVFFVIIPGQRELVAAKQAGRTADPTPGLRGRQRSVHNTYFTLPVLFTMISHHYPVTHSHPYNWALLIGLSLAGALVRVYFVQRHKGAASRRLPMTAGALTIAVVIASMPPGTPTPAAGASSLAPAEREAQAWAVTERHCTQCHAAEPRHPAFAAAPGGVRLESIDDMRRAAAQIHRQAVASQAMPPGNLTGMSEEDRVRLDQWYRGLGQ